MINVGIVGSLSAINRHTNALGKIQDIRIMGRWITGGSTESLQESDTGLYCTDPETILDNTDALIISGTGNFCSQLAVAALRNARHLFLYPSVVRSVTEAYQLIKLAREANVILKCGRTGNISVRDLIGVLPDIKDISLLELQHYRKIMSSGRTKSIAEELLGDIEIINNLIRARNISIKAKGLCMLSSQPDIINARLEFDNGCAVNYNCNLVAAQSDFFITIVVKNKILKYNFLTNEFTGWHLHRHHNLNESPIFIESIQVEQSDPLEGDLSDFFTLIFSGPAFLSINDSGFESYVLVDRILEKVMKTLIQCA